jgi:hypothetical protein
MVMKIRLSVAVIALAVLGVALLRDNYTLVACVIAAYVVGIPVREALVSRARDRRWRECGGAVYKIRG